MYTCVGQDMNFYSMYYSYFIKSAIYYETRKVHLSYLASFLL